MCGTSVPLGSAITPFQMARLGSSSALTLDLIHPPSVHSATPMLWTTVNMWCQRLSTPQAWALQASSLPETCYTLTVAELKLQDKPQLRTLLNTWLILVLSLTAVQVCAQPRSLLQ